MSENGLCTNYNEMKRKTDRDTAWSVEKKQGMIILEIERV